MKLSERAMPAATNFQKRIVSDADVEKALDWLRDNAEAIGAAKARVTYASRMVDHAEALCSKMSDATSDLKRKADARTHPKWLAAVDSERDAIAEFEKMKALREAAGAKIEAWRSEQANYRAMKL
jgi:nucleotide-binding universal stress UspA family protein